MANLVVTTITQTGKGIATRATFGTAYVPSVDGIIYLEVTLSGLNAAAATITADVEVTRSSNVIPLDAGRFAFSKRSTSATRTGFVIGPISVMASDSIQLYLASSNASDSAAVAGVIKVFDATSTDVRSLNGSSTALNNLAAFWAKSLTGTLQDATASTVTLDATASTTNSAYNRWAILLTGGTGAGQIGMIATYTGATQVATVIAGAGTTWAITPDATTTYLLIPAAAFSGNTERINNSSIAATGFGLLGNQIVSGTAQAGTSSTITLAAGASTVANVYANTLIIAGATGAGQTRLITAYDATTKIATVTPAWITTPTSSTAYLIAPMIPGDFTAAMKTSLNAATPALAASALASIAAITWAQPTYYVSTTGNDTTGDGLTPATAWLTVKKASTSITSPGLLLIGPGTFAEGDNACNFVAGVKLKGASRASTTITNTTTLSTKGCGVHCQFIEDIHVQCATVNDGSLPYASQGAWGAAGHATTPQVFFSYYEARNCRFTGDSDALFFRSKNNAPGVCVVVVQNCILATKYDTVRTLSTNTSTTNFGTVPWDIRLYFDDCLFRVDGPHMQGTSVYRPLAIGCGKAFLRRCKIIAYANDPDMVTNNGYLGAITTDFTGTADIGEGCSFETSALTNYHINVPATTPTSVGGATYTESAIDPSKVNNAGTGTIGPRFVPINGTNQIGTNAITDVPATRAAKIDNTDVLTSSRLAPATAGRTLLIANDGTITPSDGSLTASKFASAALNGKGDWHTDTQATQDAVNILSAVGNVPGFTWAHATATAFIAKFTGITSLPNWLRAMTRKSTPDTTALAEINTGGGTYDAATDSPEALASAVGAGVGTGNIPVNSDTGGTDNLSFKDSSNNGIDGASVIAYLQSEYAAGGRITRGQTFTGTDGRWVNDMNLNAGTYVFVYEAAGYASVSKVQAVS